jgi:hypothetical protein
VTPAAKRAKENKDEFDAMVKAAAPGERIVYHTGDRAGGPYRIAAYAAYERDDVLLVQRRVGKAQFEYVAIRRKKK